MFPADICARLLRVAIVVFFVIIVIFLVIVFLFIFFLGWLSSKEDIGSYRLIRRV